jgi:hypothetical protein
VTSQPDQDYELGTPNGDSEEPTETPAGHAFWRRVGLSKDTEANDTDAQPDTQSAEADDLAEPDEAEAMAETEAEADTVKDTGTESESADEPDELDDDVIVAEPDDIVVAEVIDEEPLPPVATDPAETPFVPGQDTASEQTPEPGQPAAAGSGPIAMPQAADEGPMAGRHAAGTELGQEWHDIQAAFVDDPRGAVGMAAEATDAAMSSLIDSLRSRRDALAAGLGDSSDHRDTEQLRGELRQYRMLCQNLAEIEQRLAQPQSS